MVSCCFLVPPKRDGSRIKFLEIIDSGLILKNA